MFKTSIPRQARLGYVARRQASTFLSLRPLRIQSLEQQQQLSTTHVSIRPAVLRTVVPRFYTSEAAAQKQSDTPEVGSERITQFKDLARLGVHERLVSAITEGMKYQDMTEVQSLTINSALRGTDLYEVIDLLSFE
jgi:ATP-dependent RNA helicase MSS116, mitochondrial